MSASGSSGQLRRVLGLGFGIAFVLGTMVGVGILRLPGVVAGSAGTRTSIILCWCIGGVYALMGAVSVSEVAAMYPETGGLRVYPRHAFGPRAGFIVGWIDWLATLATLAYAAVSAADFTATLWPAISSWERTFAVLLVALFGAMHAVGVRLGSSITTAASTAIGILFVVLIVACFAAAPVPSVGAGAGMGNGTGPWSAASLLAIVPALRAILTAYDGWYAPVYTAGECVNASKTLPRAIIGGAVLVMSLYIAINLALLRVLPIPVLAASTLPVADAARIALPHGSAALLEILSLLIVLSLINGQALMGPRILLSIARDGWIPAKFAQVSKGGTPLPALALTMGGGALLILTGTFNDIIALFTVLIMLNYIAVFLSVFALRRRAPDVPRPYRAWGYPASTLIVLAGSIVFLLAGIAEDWRSGVTAAVFLLLCVPAYTLAARARRAAPAAAASGPG